MAGLSGKDDLVDDGARLTGIFFEVVAKRFALYQRLDYLLHIPVEQMKKDNLFYRNVVRYLRQNVRATMTNPYLTNKNRVYLVLLTIAPRTVISLHRMVMRLRGVK